MMMLGTIAYENNGVSCRLFSTLIDIFTVRSMYELYELAKNNVNKSFYSK